jgi:ribA/ribD-fused uncharacterized protein
MSLEEAVDQCLADERIVGFTVEGAPHPETGKFVINFKSSRDTVEAAGWTTYLLPAGIPEGVPMSETAKQLLQSEGLAKYIPVMQAHQWELAQVKDEGKFFAACGIVDPADRATFRRIFNDLGVGSRWQVVGAAAAAAAPQMCAHCHAKEVFPGHQYCSRSCGADATAAGGGRGGGVGRGALGRRRTPPMDEWGWGRKPSQITFYEQHDDFYEFTNFWECDHLVVDRLQFRTAEHYFQSMKFSGLSPDLVEECRQKATPRQCFDMVREARVQNFIRGDWHKKDLSTGETTKDKVMFNGVLHKFALDATLRRLLLSTEKRPIVEHTTNDSYWGDGGVRNWKPGMEGNHLGMILEKVRSILKKDSKKKPWHAHIKVLPPAEPARPAQPGTFKHTSAPAQTAHHPPPPSQATAHYWPGVAQGYPPQPGAPAGYAPQQGVPAGYPPQQGVPAGYPPQQGVPAGYPPQPGAPAGYPPQPGAPAGYSQQPMPQASAQDLLSQQPGPPPQSAPAPQMCAHCHAKEAFPPHRYCSRSCGSAAATAATAAGTPAHRHGYAASFPMQRDQSAPLRHQHSNSGAQPPWLG